MIPQWTQNRSSKHAFISYVKEDAPRADQLQGAFEAADIKVWRDIHDLTPGRDWEHDIRSAITRGSLAFIVCFSRDSVNRKQSYLHKELTVALEQFRRFPPHKQWLFPVRLEPVEIPDRPLGSGRSLRSIHSADLFGPQRDSNLIKLTTQVARLVAR